MWLGSLIGRWRRLASVPARCTAEERGERQGGDRRMPQISLPEGNLELSKDLRLSLPFDTLGNRDPTFGRDDFENGLQPRFGAFVDIDL